MWREFSLHNTNNNQVYNNNFISNAETGFLSNANNNIFNLDAPYGGNYYQNEGVYGSSSSCPSNWIVDDAFCADGNGPRNFVGDGMDNRPWITMNGWVGYAPPSNVDLVLELNYLNPYPAGSASISEVSGYQIQVKPKNTGSGSIAGAEFHMKIVDSDGGVRYDGNPLSNADLGPDSWTIFGWQETLDSSAPLGTWTYTHYS